MGIATQIYEQVEEFAKTNNYSGVTLNTFNRFKSNLLLAIQRGYIVYALDTYGAYQNDPKIRLKLEFEES